MPWPMPRLDPVTTMIFADMAVRILLEYVIGMAVAFVNGQFDSICLYQS